ncbi:MAG: PDZ domain-containing protein [Acidobacteria bacterium]|nr:PDZ domain-containing protein [Acidobacteriota bacterium]MBK8811632.1 PDZ domain-containing protein [Acidobacteriota bacterium]
MTETINDYPVTIYTSSIMSFRGKIIIAFLSAAIASYALLGGILGSFAQQPVNDVGAQMRIFESVLQHIQNDYVDEPSMDRVRGGALRGLPSSLDPYSSYLTAEQVKDFQANKQNTLAGVGAEFSSNSSYLYVVSVIKDSPADKAGLKAGDIIEYIENKATRDISLYDARQLILGEAGSSVKLRVLRAGAKPQTLSVARGNYSIPKAESRIEAGKVGVIKIYSLEAGEAEDIRNQVQSLTKQGVQKIILDLRGVASGSIDEAVGVANLFIKDGTLAQVIGRESKPIKTFSADPSKAVFDGKMSALIDIATAGAGEVVASAILDRKRGDVIGERSFGAGTEQKLFTLKNSGDGLLLTVAKWASAEGKPFLGDNRLNSGVMPSVEVKRPETPEPLEVEDLVDQQEQNEQQPNPSPSPTATPKVEQPKVLEDIQLKKALELMQDK